MQVLVGLSKKNIPDYLNYTNSFIIGLKDFSINYVEYDIYEIEKLKKDYPQLELFISINKNIFNNDLPLLEDYLLKLNKLKVNGILFYDLSVMYLCHKYHLDIPLIWGAEHMTTNYNTCNYYYNKGCKYTFLSSEITCDEIKEIKEKSPIKLISFVFGYPLVSFSKRKLLTNYFLYHQLKKDNDWYTIKSDDEHKYFIKENKLGTSILYGKVMNGIKPVNDLKDILDYGLLSNELMDEEVFKKGLMVYKNFIDEKIDVNEAQKEINELVQSDDTVFYYKKTIYKVKDEK